MQEIVFATTNPGKVRELQHFFTNHSYKILSLNDFFEKDNLPDVLETGSTFAENAAIKARAYFEMLKLPVIADDSGLVVPALNGEPGIYSARYAGENANDRENNKKLLSKLDGISKEQRRAYFVCELVLIDNKLEKLFSGQTWGEIIEQERGNNGFGYDPLFYLPELKKTFAELELQEKSRYSHRGKALRSLVDFLQQKKNI